MAGAIKQRGFSLIEVIIGIFLILTAFGLCILQITIAEATKKQRYEDVAYQVANRQMESLRATDFALLPSSGSVSDSALSQIPSGAGTYTSSNYASFTGVKELVVTVTWNDGSSKSVVLRTLAQSGGLNP